MYFISLFLYYWDKYKVMHGDRMCRIISHSTGCSTAMCVKIRLGKFCTLVQRILFEFSDTESVL